MEPIVLNRDSRLIGMQHHRQCSLGSTLTPLWRPRKPSVPFGVSSSMEIKQNDNRRYIRKPVPICAWLEFREEHSTRAMRSLDLSAQGARFSTIRPVAKDDLVMVRLEVRPGAPAVECKGRVCWAEPLEDQITEFGVRFLDLVEDERAQIRRAMREDASQQPLATI